MLHLWFNYGYQESAFIKIVAHEKFIFAAIFLIHNLDLGNTACSRLSITVSNVCEGQVQFTLEVCTTVCSLCDEAKEKFCLF